MSVDHDHADLEEGGDLDEPGEWLGGLRAAGLPVRSERTTVRTTPPGQPGSCGGSPTAPSPSRARYARRTAELTARHTRSGSARRVRVSSCSLALAQGIHSALSSPLLIADAPGGALNMYSNDEHAFGTREQEQAALFATEASNILTIAGPGCLSFKPGGWPALPQAG